MGLFGLGGNPSDNFNNVFAGTRTGDVIQANGGNVNNPNTWLPAVMQAQQTTKANAATNAASSAGGSGGSSSSTTSTISPAAVSAINAGYGQVLSTLDRIMGDLPNQQNIANQQVNNQYNSQRASAQSGYDSGTAHLTQAKTDLSTATQKSLRQLAQGLRDQFSSWDALLGNQGAGFSSAAGPNGMLSYALQKVGNQNRSDILDSQNQQMTQINLKQSDLDRQLNDQVQQLDTWKNNQILSIAQQFAQQKNDLDLQRAGASRDKLLAIANANQGLVNQALSSLATVESQHNQAVANINKAIQAPTVDASNMAGTNYAVVSPTGQGIPGISISSNATGGIAIPGTFKDDKTGV